MFFLFLKNPFSSIIKEFSNKNWETLRFKNLKPTQEQCILLFAGTIYTIIGILCIFLKEPLIDLYYFIYAYIMFKWLLDYRLCTLSYIECKIIRGIPKEEGILYNLLNEITNLRDTYYIYPYMIIFVLFTYYKFYICKEPLVI